MGDKVTTTTAGRREGGFALILAILALMLLTFLGLTLATSTSQELQIATNYRWNQQALYNAEAGMEIGKAVLRDVNWANVLTPDRGITWNMTTGPTAQAPDVSACVNCGLSGGKDSQGRNLRNLENRPCDAYGGGTGFGVVLVDDGGTAYQYVTNVMGQNVNGAFTIWVRRKVEVADGDLSDVDASDQLIMTVEGIAPYTSASADSAISQTNRSVKFLEFDMSREARESSICGTRAGQAGAGPEGANFGGCVAMDAKRVAEGLGTSATLTETGAK